MTKTDWNKKPYVDEEGTLHFGRYWDTGGMIVNRECLDVDHPEHMYNYLKSAGITPEDYGFECPVIASAKETYGHMSREELINLCYNQAKHIEAMERAGF